MPPDTRVKTSTAASVGSWGGAAPFAALRVLPFLVTRAFVAALAALLLSAPAARARRICRWICPATSTASSVRADPDTWLVGAVPGAASADDRRPLRRRATRARRLRGRALAGARRSPPRCASATCSSTRRPTCSSRPLGRPRRPALRGRRTTGARRSRRRTLTPPPVTPESPLIALVDAAADLTHPEWTGDPNIATLPGVPVTNLARHRDRLGRRRRRRTGSASSASGRARGRSTSRCETVPGTDGEITCAASGKAIGQAVARPAPR